MARRFPTESSSVNLGVEEDFIELEDEVGDLPPPFPPTQSSHKPNKRSRTSSVWDIYTRYEITENGKNVEKAKCKLCGKIYSAKSKGGTGHLLRHKETCVKNHRPENVGTGRPGSQTQISTTGGSSSSSLGIFSFNAQSARQGLVKMIVLSELPFAFVENEFFEQWVQQYCQPQFHSISRNTTRNDAIRLWQEEKINIKIYFAEIPGRIAITTDMWTSRGGDSYLCITAHNIDAKWIMNKRILSFTCLEWPHNGTRISTLILEKLDEYNIKEKVLSVTLNNASNNTVAIELMRMQMPLASLIDGCIFQNRCVCHILNLIAKVGLKHITSYTDAIKDIARFVFCSAQRRQLYAQICARHGVSAIKLPKEVEHRWNSIYDLLNKALSRKNILNEFCAFHAQNLMISDEHWELCAHIRDLLEPFYTSTLFFSGIYYPTSNESLIKLFKITLQFSRFRDHFLLGNTIREMEEKFNKYWKEAPMTFSLAAVFDPRLKLSGVKFFIEEINKNMNYIDLNVFSNIRANLQALFQFYCERMGTAGLSMENSEVPQTGVGEWDMWYSSLSTGMASSSSSSNSVTELSSYLDVGVIRLQDASSFDLLAWWKQQESIYPVLAAMARDLLTIPMSSVASEQAFSAGGRVVDDRRTNLTEETVECCVCLRDWYLADKRKQELASMEDFDPAEYISGLQI